MKSINLVAQLVSSNRFEMPAVNTVVILSAVGDFNADGIADIAITGMDLGADASRTSDIRVLLAQPQGRFIDATHILQQKIPSYQTASLVSADINNDGFTDLVLGRSGGDNDTTSGVFGATQLVYRSNGDGTYSAIQSPDAAYAHNAMVADVNGDSLADAFFFATGVGSSVLMLSDNGTVRFTTDGLPKQALYAETWKSWDVLETYPNNAMKTAQIWHQHNTAFNDVDRDGDLDMIMFFGSGSQEGLIYKNDGNGFFDQNPGIKFDANIPGVAAAGNYMYGLLNPDGSWAGLKVIGKGPNYYETVQFDVDRDGWEDVVAVATSNNISYTHLTNSDIQFDTGSDWFCRGTYYKVLLNTGSGLSDQTAERVQQPSVTHNVNYHYGHFGMMHAVDLNGDGSLDIVSNTGGSTPLNMPNGVGESDTVFMLNNGKGRFEQISIMGLEFGAFDPLPIDGKLGFIANVAPTPREWQTVGQPSRPYWDTYFYRTNVPWTIGDSANNFVYGTNSNDRIDGQGGVDTFVALGRSDEFALTQINTGLVAQDLRGLTGTDHLANVERIRFYDKTLAYDLEGNAGQAFRIYKAALDRVAEPSGLAGWIKYMDEGASLTTVSQHFIDSQEFKTKYGNLDNRGFVNQLYQNVLDRDGEAAGISSWLNGMSNGLTRAQVLAGFSESSENRANVQDLIKTGVSYSEWWLA